MDFLLNSRYFHREHSTLIIQIKTVVKMGKTSVRVFKRTAFEICCAAVPVGRTTGLVRLSVCLSVPYGLLTRGRKGLQNQNHCDGI